MRHEYTAAVVSGVALGIALLGWQITGRPNSKWDLVFLSVAGILGGLTTYFSRTHSSIRLHLNKAAAIGGAVGLAAGVFNFVSGAVFFLVVTNRNIVFNTRSIKLAIIGLVQLTVASGFGGLVMGLLLRLRRTVVEKV
jgi:hypothetical protein